MFLILCKVCVKFVICISGIVLVVLYVILCVVLFNLVDLFLGIIIVCILVVLVFCRYVFKLCGFVMLFSINKKGVFLWVIILLRFFLLYICVVLILVIMFWCCLLFVLLFSVLCCINWIEILNLCVWLIIGFKCLFLCFFKV